MLYCLYSNAAPSVSSRFAFLVLLLFNPIMPALFIIYNYYYFLFVPLKEEPFEAEYIRIRK